MKNLTLPELRAKRLSLMQELHQVKTKLQENLDTWIPKEKGSGKALNQLLTFRESIKNRIRDIGQEIAEVQEYISIQKPNSDTIAKRFMEVAKIELDPDTFDSILELARDIIEEDILRDKRSNR